MKLREHQQGPQQTIAIAGQVEGGSCGCIEAFFACRIDPEATLIALELDELEGIDALGIAVLTRELATLRRHEAKITISDAPQLLAHTLYKAGMLAGPNPIILRNPRSEEPYAG